MTHSEFPAMVKESWARAVASASVDLARFRPVLIEGLRSKDAEVRSAAVAALFEGDDDESHDAIIPLIDDPDPKVRHEVVGYLTEYAVETDAETLFSALTAHPDLSFLLSMALMQATGRVDGVMQDEDAPEDRDRELRLWREYLAARGLLSTRR
jgi:hypothetical protein